jgi:pimeloyl-ACP methyl ester carboxylesterase
VADADEYERLIPSSRKILLDDTGHVPMLERPATFNDGLLGFLAEPAGSAGGQPAAAVGDRV